MKKLIMLLSLGLCSLQSFSQLQKNSIVLAFDFFATRSINYERIFLQKDKISLALRAGAGEDIDNHFVMVAEPFVLFGKFKHFLEFGFGYQHRPRLNAHLDIGHPQQAAIMLGYRRQSPKGFMFKVTPMLIIEEFIPPKISDPNEEDAAWGNFPWLGFAIGYSF